MLQLRTFVLVVICLGLAPAQPTVGESLNARNVVLNHPVSFQIPGGAQAVASPGVYRLEPENDSLLRLVSSRGTSIVAVVATRITHRMPVPEPIALTRSEGETIFRMALLFPDGHGLEAVGTTMGVNTRDVRGTTTISLGRLTHFGAPDGSDVIAEPGTYRIEAISPAQLGLVPADGKPTVAVQALETSHRESLSTPVATIVTEESDVVHLLLLFPEGSALDAIGSYSAVRTRAPLEALKSARIAAVVKIPVAAAQLSQPASGPQPVPTTAQTRNKVVLSPDAGPSGIVVQVSACGLQGPAGTPLRVRVSGLGAPDQELTPSPCANGGYGFGPGTNLPPVPMKVQSILGGNSVAVDLVGPNPSTPIERSVGFFAVKPSVAVGKITSLHVRTDFFAGFFDQCTLHSHVIVTLDTQGDVKFGITGKTDMAEAMTQVLQEAWGRDRPVRISYNHTDFLSCHPANSIIGVEGLR